MNQRLVTATQVGAADPSFKLLLILEALFAGAYVAMTQGVLFVYLVSIGSGIHGISIAVGIAAITTTIVHIVLYKYPRFLLTRVRLKFVLVLALTRILFVFIPFMRDYLQISVIFGVISCAPTSTFMYLVIYGSLSKDEIKDVTAKRMAAFYASSVVGFLLAMILLAFVPPQMKFVYIYAIGSLIGMGDVLVVSFMNFSHIERMPVVTGIEKPERVFSTSSYLIVVLASGNLLLMVWTPYVMEYLNGPDYLVVAMNLAGMLATVLGSLFWRGCSFRTLRNTVGLDAAAPMLAPFVPIPVVHVFLSGLSSFTYTGSNFIGNFLFAGYNRWLGAIKSSILLVIVLSVAQALIAPVGVFFREDYLLIFSVVIGLKLIAMMIGLLTIPEVAAVPEETARLYSYVLYNKSLSGYRISVEVSRDTILLTLRLLGLFLILLTLYVIYRALFLLMS
ncbi:hypothetical protein [[Eubacterium] cellulosolvens]